MKLQTKSITLPANILITVYDQMSVKVPLASLCYGLELNSNSEKNSQKYFCEYVATVKTEGSLIQNVSSSFCAKKSA